MGDSVFRKLQKILKKPQAPAHIRQRQYQVEIPWHQQFWAAIRPPPAVAGEQKPMNPMQRSLLWVTLAVALAGAGAWAVYDYQSSAPRRAEDAFQAAVKLQASGNMTGAIETFSTALAISEDARTYLERGNVRRNLGQMQEALGDWNRAIAVDPQLADAYTARGKYHMEAGALDEALKDLDESVRLKPTVDGYFQRGQVRAALGNYEQAIADYDEAIGEMPQAPYVYLARASAKRAVGDEAGYEADHQRGLELQGVR